MHEYSTRYVPLLSTPTTQRKLCSHHMSIGTQHNHDAVNCRNPRNPNGPNDKPQPIQTTYRSQTTSIKAYRGHRTAAKSTGPSVYVENMANTYYSFPGHLEQHDPTHDGNSRIIIDIAEHPSHCPHSSDRIKDY